MDRLEGHRRIDARSLAMHRAIAAKILENPCLVGIARANLDRWEPTMAAHSRFYLTEWRRLLEKPVEELAALIVEESEAMTAMRQATPFGGVLTPQERWRIYDSYATGTYHPGSGLDREP